MKPKSNPFLRSVSLFATGLLISFSALPAYSATRDWSATAADTVWATGTNWVGGTAPLGTDSARFNQTTYAFHPNYGTATIAGLIFGDGTTVTAASTLSGTTLTLGGDIVVNANAGVATIAGTNPIKWASKNATNNSENELVISAGLTSQGSSSTTTLGFNGTKKVLVSGPIKNGGGTNKIAINKTSSGTLTLSGTNTFTGGVTLGGANFGSQLNLNSPTALGAAASVLTINGGDKAKIDNTSNGAITIANGNPQAWNSDFTFVGSNDLNMGTGNITLGGTRTVTANAKNLTLGGVITDGAGTYNLTKAGAGTLTLTNANTYDGVTTVNGGFLRPTHASALGSVTGGTTAGVGTNGAGSLELTGGLTTNSAETLTISGSGTDFFGALRAGTDGGTWAGQINIGANGARIGATTGNTLTVTGSIVNGAGSSFAISGQSGNGVVVINPTTSNTYTGKTDIVRGILRLGKTDALPTGTMLDVDVASGVDDPAVFDLAGFNQTAGGLRDGATSSFTGKVTNSVASTNSTLTLNQSETTFYEGIIEDGAGTVSLVKNGNGTLELNGINTYTGATSLNAGRINVGGTLASPMTVAAGAVIGGEGSLIGTGSLSFGAGTSTLSFNPTTPGSLTVSSLTTSGATILVTPEGPVTNNETYVVLTNSAGFSGTPSPTFIPTSRGTLAFGGTNNTELQFTPTTSAALTWKGNAANPTFWDINTTANWNNGTAVFFNLDSVTFDDSATSTDVVIQPSSVSVGAGVITVNNPTKPYSISGGGMTGEASLVKSGNASLTLANANSYTGGTTLNAGALNINHASALGAASGAFTINGGTLDNTSGAAVTTGNHPLTLNADVSFTGTNNLSLGAGATSLGENLGTSPSEVRNITTVASNLTLSGVINNGINVYGVTKLGSGTLTLGGASTYSGLTTISAGTLKLGASSGATAGPLGATTTETVLESGASLDFAGFGVNVEPITISGTGVGGNGALVNSGADQSNAIRFLTLAADASVGGNGNRFDIRGANATTGLGTLALGNHTLTKTGSGYVAIVYTTVETGHIDVLGGSLGLHATNVLDGDASNTITIRNGAALDCYQVGTWNAPIWSVIMDAGSNFTNSNGTAIWDSTVTLNGAVNAGGSATLTLNGVVSGSSGALTKTGAGTLNLNGTEANTYAGTTTVSAGTLALGKTAEVNAVPGGITINAGGVSLQADQQIPDNATVTLTTATSKFNINSKNETIANLDIQNANNATSEGLLTGGSPGGKLTITGTLTHTTGNITFNSSGAGNSSVIDANTVINNGGSWVFGAVDGTQKLLVGTGGLTIGNGSTIAVNALVGVADNFISLGGNLTSTAADTSNVISGAGTIQLNDTRTVTVADGAAASDLTISTVLTNGSGTGSIVKEGVGTLNLIGAHTYSGTTTINAGVISGRGSIAGPVVVNAAGTLAPATTATETLTVASADFSAGGTLAIDINDTPTPINDVLNVTGVLNITDAKLVISAGTVAGSSYTLVNAGSITGTFAPANITGLPAGYQLDYATPGKINLVPVPVGGFTNWINTNYPTLSDKNATGDPDGDGVNNLLEYVLNGVPNVADASVLPKVSVSGGNFVFTFSRRNESVATNPLVFQSNSDLGATWNEITIPATTEGSVEITPNTPSTGIDQVVVTLSKGSNVTLFGRLKVTE